MYARGGDPFCWHMPDRPPSAMGEAWACDYCGAELRETPFNRTSTAAAPTRHIYDDLPFSRLSPDRGEGGPEGE